MIEKVLPALYQVLLHTVGPVVSLGLAALIGYRLTAYWAERQKKREFELALANSFYSSYGEFCAVWKYWNQSLKELPEGSDELNNRRTALLDRACKAEGGLEAALLKVASERVLTMTELNDLGNLRQVYQVLRERIQNSDRITYEASDHRDYLEFKRLATQFGVLLASKPVKQGPAPEEAYAAFQEITNNKYEQRWKQAGRKRI
jgi:hypothetical protein